MIWGVFPLFLETPIYYPLRVVIAPQWSSVRHDYVLALSPKSHVTSQLIYSSQTLRPNGWSIVCNEPEEPTKNGTFDIETSTTSTFAYTPTIHVSLMHPTISLILLHHPHYHLGRNWTSTNNQPTLHVSYPTGEPGWARPVTLLPEQSLPLPSRRSSPVDRLIQNGFSGKSGVKHDEMPVKHS